MDGNLLKLEILGDKKTLLPDMIETLKSTEILTKEGFKVMVYCNDDPLMAKRLENVGAVSNYASCCTNRLRIRNSK